MKIETIRSIFLRTISALLVLSFLLPLKSVYAATVDFIIAVDTSASMLDENQAFQNNFNNFASSLSSLDIDARFILLSDNSICIPAPIGSGLCPGDENLSDYRHVDVAVGSTNAQSQILNTYSQWSSSLRPGVEKDLIVLTDDSAGMTAQNFIASLLQLNSDFQGFNFFGFIDPALGGGYQQLASLAGGSIFDITSPNFDIEFSVTLPQEISTNVVPIPGAVWLFSGSLLGLIGAARRKLRT